MFQLLKNALISKSHDLDLKSAVQFLVLGKNGFAIKETKRKPSATEKSEKNDSNLKVDNSEHPNMDENFAKKQYNTRYYKNSNKKDSNQNKHQSNDNNQPKNKRKTTFRPFELEKIEKVIEKPSNNVPQSPVEKCCWNRLPSFEKPPLNNVSKDLPTSDCTPAQKKTIPKPKYRSVGVQTDIDIKPQRQNRYKTGRKVFIKPRMRSFYPKFDNSIYREPNLFSEQLREFPEESGRIYPHSPMRQYISNNSMYSVHGAASKYRNQYMPHSYEEAPPILMSSAPPYDTVPPMYYCIPVEQEIPGSYNCDGMHFVQDAAPFDQSYERFPPMNPVPMSPTPFEEMRHCFRPSIVNSDKSIANVANVTSSCDKSSDCKINCSKSEVNISANDDPTEEMPSPEELWSLYKIIQNWRKIYCKTKDAPSQTNGSN